MIIRQAVKGDALAIATIHVRSWQHAYRDLLPADQLAALSIADRVQQWQRQLDATSTLKTIVAEIDDAVMGFASWDLIPDSQPATAMLFSIYVAPDATSRGIGSALLTRAEQDMLLAGSQEATLHVLADNAPTRVFYQRHGWQPIPDSELTEQFFGIEVRTIGYHKRLS